MPQYRNIPLNASCYSEIGVPGEKVLCVSVSELKECEISEGYLKRAFSGQRHGEIYIWPHHKEGREIFIHFDGLSEKYRRLINNILCGGIDAHLWVENQVAAQLNRKLSSFKRSLREMVEVDPADLERLSETGLYIPMDVQRIGRAAGWLRLWRRLDVRTVRRYGFSSITEVQQEMFKQCLNEQERGFVKFPKPISNERALDRKAREYARKGLDCLIAGYFGNANRGEMDPRSHSILMTLASAQVKYSFEDIGMFYNEQAAALGLPKRTVSSIKQYLNLPKNKKIWYSVRHGKVVANLEMIPMIDREKPSRPDALWSLDGTTMQLYYKKLARDKRGNEKWKLFSDLYAYFITDACTDAIIGCSVALTETSGMVIEALRDAVSRQKYIPYQMNFDNGAANVAHQVKALQENMAHASFPCMPESGRSKTVELVIGHFQQRELRKFENFKGGNVNVRSNNSTANRELLEYLQEHMELVPTEQEVIRQFGEGIDAWNSRGEGRDAYGAFIGRSKMERYREHYEGRRAVNHFEIMSLFVVELKNRRHPFGEYVYGQKGIELEMGGKKLKYIVPDSADRVMDFDFSRENLGRTFKVKINLNVTRSEWIELYDRNGKFVATAWEKEKLAGCVEDMKKKPGQFLKLREAVERQKEFYGEAVREIDLQKAQAAKAGFRMTGTDGLGWWDSPKEIENARNSLLEDRRNGIVEKSPDDIELEALLNS